jgi:hypothetical protein
MLPVRDYETAIRLSIAYASISVGTVLLLAGITNTTADGEPFSFPIWNSLNFPILLTPSLAAMIYLFLGKKLRVLSWLFTAFCCCWVYYTYSIYASDGFKFQYWHQGDVVCNSCDTVYFLLSAATVIYGLWGGAMVATRLGRNTNAAYVLMSIPAITTISLILTMYGLGLAAPLFGVCGVIIITRQLDHSASPYRNRLSTAAVVLVLLLFSMLAFGLS